MRNKKGYATESVALMLILVAYALFAREPVTSRGAGVTASQPGGLTELVQTLRGAGAMASTVGHFEQPFFSVRGVIVEVEGVSLLVMEYPSEAARWLEARQIAPDGMLIGTRPVTWANSPNFWTWGKTIVLYLGEDTRMVSLLNKVLGPRLIPTHS